MGQHVRAVRSTDNQDAVADGASNRVVAPRSAPAVVRRPVNWRSAARGYREGLLVSHDEPETGPGVAEDRDATNFSYVDWREIADALHLKVDTDAQNDPRFG